MYNGKSIDSMNFEELRKFVKVLNSQVQELSDLYAKTKREYNDMLYNLSRDNLSIEYIQEEREFVNSVVDNKNQGIMEGMATLETRIMQNEEKIELKASMEDVNEKAETIINQTAQGISTLALRQVDLKNAIEVVSPSEMTDDDKIYKICKKENGKIVAETYYYYNDLGDEWVPFQGENIYTVFTQTEDGFLFKGNVIIDGDAVVTKNLKAQKIVSQDGNEIGMLTISYNNENVSFPDLTYYGKINGSYWELFGIRYDGTGVASMRLKENTIGYVGSELGYFWPQGTWNFSSQQCEVMGLGVVPVFG